MKSIQPEKSLANGTVGAENVLGESPGVRPAGDTLVGLEDATLVTRREGSQRKTAEKAFLSTVEILAELERDHSRPRVLTNQKGYLSLQRMLSELDGTVLSDGVVVSTEMSGRITFSTPLKVAAPEKNSSEITMCVAELERSLKGPQGTSPHTPVHLATSLSSELVRKFMRGVMRTLDHAPTRPLKISVPENPKSALMNEVRGFDGMLLDSGRVLRVAANGTVTVQKRFVLGANGWNPEQIERDLKLVARHAASADEKGVPFKLWIPHEKYCGSPLRESIRRHLCAMRRDGIADRMIIETESSRADALPGFVRARTRAIVIKEGTAETGTPTATLERIDARFTQLSHERPSVIWIQGARIDAALERKMVELRSQRGGELKILGSRALEENHPRLFREPQLYREAEHRSLLPRLIEGAAKLAEKIRIPIFRWRKT